MTEPTASLGQRIVPSLLGQGEPQSRGTAGRLGVTLDTLARAGVPVPAAALLPVGCEELGGDAAGDISGNTSGDILAEALLSAVGLLERQTGSRLGDPSTPLILAIRTSPVREQGGKPHCLLGIGAPATRRSARVGAAAVNGAVTGENHSKAPGPASMERGIALARQCFVRGLAPALSRVLGETVDDAFDQQLDAWDDAPSETPAAHTAAEIACAEALEQAAASDPAWPGTAMDALLTAAETLLAQWHDSDAAARRATLGGDDRLALIVQQVILPDMPAASEPPSPLPDGRLTLRLHSPESGRWKPAGRLLPQTLGLARSIGSPAPIQIDETNASEAGFSPILETAKQVQRVLKHPVSISAAVLGGTLEILDAVPLRARAAASVRIAVDAASAGEISREDALRQVAPKSLEEMLHPTIDADCPRERVAHGLPASPGAVTGRLAFTAEAVEALSITGEAAILARAETNPGDVQGMHAAAGVLTTRGGLTSHAAVVARGLGRPCVVGASDAHIDAQNSRLTTASGHVFGPGDLITLDGSEGTALAGAVPTRRPELTGAFAQLLRWADDARRMAVRANADTPQDAETARRLGVDGVGLCRTEHMFFEKSRIVVMREMILADSEADRRAALDRLLPMQREDFERFFEIMSDTAAAGQISGIESGFGIEGPVPVTIRLLDPPLHEFLPQTADGIRALAAATGQPARKIERRALELREYNPMLGKRGCRMGVAFPEIYEMQARAIFEAALAVEARTGRQQAPEIMIPLVSAVREIELLAAKIAGVARQVAEERGATPSYTIGIMIETPRAALRAQALGERVAFFSIGTNDLTQMTFGLSRDDAGRLMRDYVERGVFEADPFQSLDREGVGELIQIAVERGHRGNAALEIGLCGEHGGNPSTIAFCEAAGLDYVSCSPFRAPIARLAAAQAALADDPMALAEVGYELGFGSGGHV